MNILLIEDNPDHVEIIKDMLFEPVVEQDNPDLHHVTTFEDGMNQLATHQYDICLCDLSLPDSSSSETVSRLQKSNTATAIVVLTSLELQYAEKQLIESGIQDFIPKDELTPTLLKRVIFHAIERKKLINKIEEVVRTDDLTGLYNRREFYRLLNHHIITAKRNHFPLTLCLLDVDNFKQINDTYGHQVGDRALQLISQILKATLRDADIAARIGGDEFVLLMPYSDVEHAIHCARRIKEELSKSPLEINDSCQFVTLSLGIADYQVATSLEDFILQADKALYTSKENGRNCLTVYDASVQA